MQLIILVLKKIVACKTRTMSVAHRLGFFCVTHFETMMISATIVVVGFLIAQPLRLERMLSFWFFFFLVL